MYFDHQSFYLLKNIANENESGTITFSTSHQKWMQTNLVMTWEISVINTFQIKSRKKCDFMSLYHSFDKEFDPAKVLLNEDERSW